MARVAPCPHCTAPLLVGTTDDPERRLRCPTCAAEFQVAEVLDRSENVPEAVEVPSTEPVSAPPIIPGPPPINTPGTGTGPPPLPSAAASESAETPDDDFADGDITEEEVGNCRYTPPPIDVEESPATSPAQDEAAFGFLGDQPASGESTFAAVGEGDYEPSGRRSRPPPPTLAQSTGTLLRTLGGVVGGGIMGLVLGYAVLVLVFGSRYDFLKVGDKLRSWFSSGASSTETAEFEFADTPLESSPDEPPMFAFLPPSEVEAPAAARTFTPLSEFTEPQLPEVQEDAPPAIGPIHFTSLSSAELGSVLAGANRALGCPRCEATGFVKEVVVTGQREVEGRSIETKAEQKTSCPECAGQPITRLTADSYAQLCRLAEAVTFVKVEPGDTSVQSRRDAARSLLLRMATEQKRLETLGRLARERLADSHRGDHGIALAGTVVESGQEGPIYWIRLILFSRPDVVTVANSRPPTPALKPDDRIAVLGTIVDDPLENLAGYEGKLPQVIWGGLAVRIP